MQTAKTLIRLGECHFVGFVMRRLIRVGMDRPGQSVYPDQTAPDGEV